MAPRNLRSGWLILLGLSVVAVARAEPGPPPPGYELRAISSGLAPEDVRSITQMAFRPGDPDHLYVTRFNESNLDGRVTRYDYAASGEPLDKAGAYGIQGLASRFVDRIDGCYFNVVGLPVSRVYAALRELNL